MFPAEGGGGSSRTLERGRMVNPDTGLESDYEEMWRDVEPEPAGPIPSSSSSSSAAAPNPAPDGPQQARPRCVVLELRDDAAERRGLVVRLGRHFQGVVRCGAEFGLERWAWGPSGEGGRFAWARRTRVGALYIPCEEALKDPGLEVGASLQRDGVVWTAVEVCDV